MPTAFARGLILETLPTYYNSGTLKKLTICKALGRRNVLFFNNITKSDLQAYKI